MREVNLQTSGFGDQTSSLQDKIDDKQQNAGRSSTKSFSIAAALAVCFSLSALAPANATVIISHLGANDPTTEGWTQNGSDPLVNVGPSINDGGTGLDAWIVDDNGTSSGDFTSYSASLTAPEVTEAFSRGWILSGTIRVADANDSLDQAISLLLNTGTQRYHLTFGSDSDGDAIVQVCETGLCESGDGTSFTSEGLGSAFIEYELIYNPIAGNADLFVNGVEQISDYTGIASATPARVLFGSSSSNDTGDGRFNAVQFTIVPTPSAVFSILLGLGILGYRKR